MNAKVYQYFFNFSDPGQNTGNTHLEEERQRIFLFFIRLITIENIISKLVAEIRKSY
jgi:hypothetical protein